MGDNNQLVILQHNLGHGRVATGELRTFATRRHAALLLLQEPWVNMGKVCGLGTTSNRILVGTTTETPLACIVVLDTRMDVLLLTNLRSKYCVCAQVATGTFFAVSLYLPPSMPVPLLRRLALRIGRMPALIGGDFNAMSPAWHAPRANTRGTEIEDLLAETSCSILNAPY